MTTMLDLTKPVCTRDGRAARIVETDSTHTMGPYRYPVVAEVEHPNEPGQWVRWHYMEDGLWKCGDPSPHNDLINVDVYEYMKGERERHAAWARGIGEAQRAAVIESGVTDEKAIMVLCAAFNRASENMEEGGTKYRLSDDEFGDILEGCGAGARRVSTWLRKERGGRSWVVTLKGATLFNLMGAATQKAWEARP